ncbi:MAG TPA: hypothetical protein VNL98_08270 [Gemmatimonadales bacterium]|nr:hypothetical protein [Gemmatimonadales bacterium]
MSADHSVERSRSVKAGFDLAADREELERLVEARQVPAGRAVRRFLQAIGKGAVAFYAYVSLVPAIFAGNISSAITLSGAGLWRNIVVPAGVGVIGACALWLYERRQRRLTREEQVAKLQRTIADLVGPGWVRRTIGRGLLMGLGIGVPMGALVAWLSPIGDRLGGSATATFMAFQLFTIAWTVPASFWIRWTAVDGLERDLEHPLT